MLGQHTGGSGPEWGGPSWVRRETRQQRQHHGRLKSDSVCKILLLMESQKVKDLSAFFAFSCHTCRHCLRISSLSGLTCWSYRVAIGTVAWKKTFVHVAGMFSLCLSRWSHRWQMSDCCEEVCWIRSKQAAHEDACEGSINLLNESKRIQHLLFGKPFNPKHLTQETVLWWNLGGSCNLSWWKAKGEQQLASRLKVGKEQNEKNNVLFFSLRLLG